MEKQRWEESEKRREEERRSEKRKSQKKEDAGAWKGRKVANHCVFLMICGSGGWKSRLAKAVGGGSFGRMRDKQMHAVAARSTFPNQNAPNTSCSDHFWKLKCRKNARSCGAKRVSKSKRAKHLSVGALLAVDMLKTRWSPRTRMLTRMLMVQMSKHMVMQSRTIPFCNSLFEQSCTCFPCYQSAVWSGKCRVWSVK